jgi:hypothetical protein
MKTVKTMKNLMQPTLLVLALAAAFPAAAESTDELAKELRALRSRVTELEQQVQAGPGMTSDEKSEFNRIATKTEAIQDGLADKGLAGLKVSGYIEPAFVYNKRQDRAGFQFLNKASSYTYDTSYMGAAVLDLLKETDNGTLWHLSLAPNRATGGVVDGVSIVQEASVSVPLDSGMRLLAGQVPDWSGYEYLQPTLNPFTSHNLLFDFTLPTAYTGAGLEIKDGPWWIRTMLGNVNAAARQSQEKSPSWAFRADYAKGEFSGWGFASLIGKAPRFYTDTSSESAGYYKDTSGNVQPLVDVDGDPLMVEVSTDGQAADLAVMLEVDGWFTRGDWTFGGQVSYGQQKNAAIALDADGKRQKAQWAGVSGMVGYSLTPRLQLLARADYLKNDKNGGGLFTYNYADGVNGIGPGNGATDDPQRGANRFAITLGTKFLFNPSTTFKAEYRFDGADRAVFEDVGSGTHKKNNQMVAASMVVAF